MVSGLHQQAVNYIYQCNMEALEEELTKQRSPPSGWAPMAGNTQLFEVDLTDPAVSELVSAMKDAGAQVVKVSPNPYWQVAVYFEAALQPQCSAEQAYGRPFGGKPQVSLHIEHIALQVHRIQNKLLWKVYASNLDAMRARWQDEPALHLVNGGLPSLWHGTSLADPWNIYAAEHGQSGAS